MKQVLNEHTRDASPAMAQHIYRGVLSQGFGEVLSWRDSGRDRFFGEARTDDVTEASSGCQCIGSFEGMMTSAQISA